MRTLVGVGALVTAMLLLTGCAGFDSSGTGGVARGIIVGDVTYPNYINGHTQVQLTTNDFTIIKTVTAEASSVNVLGIVGTGDNGYGKLFDEARAAGGDDVINVRVDTRKQSVLGVFWVRATTRLTGTVIRWKK